MDLRLVRKAKVRSFPSPEDGLRSLVDRAPEAEEFAARTMERLRPHADWVYNFRRRIATLAVTVFSVWLFVHVVFGANGMAQYRQKKNEYQSLQKQIDLLQKENDRASHEINALQQDPTAIEKQAREQLHYAKPGEVIFVAPAPAPPPAAPVTHSAHN